METRLSLDPSGKGISAPLAALDQMEMAALPLETHRPDGVLVGKHV